MTPQDRATRRTTEHLSRSLLGWWLRFTQPGRGIGPGDLLNDPYYRVPDRLGDRGWLVCRGGLGVALGAADVREC
ncbi:hypothetical protein XACJK4_720002 [Xanthomonas citri pv. citri]|nr:hypothetical protein XAC908_340084 [Xanthomonas citri pv. citri]CEH56287.1 hypothetical protein XAC3610_3280002 [Xanthomonas citri pv. citri]CEJ22595.1 hypothetical protein XACE116_3100002 [Xanthomonas citri pv. citri]CEJ27185.1 hypothetical protein XACE116_3100002 [Xanthomonas citri pv. citri]CEL41568.1 hypothetical protein XACJK4_720002 [Xanthomonas citri pv. citri]